MKKELYTYSDYQKDINFILNYIKAKKINHIVGIFRGSLPLAVAISNRAKIPMSVIDYQTRDGNSKFPYLAIKRKEIDKNTLIIDDIYDTGKTIKDINKIFPQAHYLTIFKSNKTEPIKNLTWIRNSDKWIVFEMWE